MKSNRALLWFLLSVVSLSVLVSLVAIYLSIESSSQPVRLTSDEIIIASVKNEIYSRFFEIFGIVATLLGTLSAILGFGAYTILSSRLDRLMDEAIYQRVTVAQARTLAISFNEHAFSWYRRYEPVLQKILEEKSVENPEIRRECLENIEISRDLASHGLEPFEALTDQQKELFLSSKLGRRARVNILNQIIYSETARILVSDERPSKFLVEDLELKAEELLSLGISQELADEDYNWWEAVETVGFFRSHIGLKFTYPQLQSSGISLILNLVNEQRLKTYLKPLPQEVSETVRNEYRRNGFEEVI